MKYYSEILDDFFDTELELVDAEAKQKADDVAKMTEEEFLKEEIEKADLSIKEAYNALDEARNQVKELQKKYDEEIEAINDKYNLLVDDIMNPVNDQLMKALSNRDDLLIEYNKKYGPYMRIYSDRQSLDKLFTTNSIFNQFLKDLGI